MERPPQVWHIERTSPVRADAEGLFVRGDELPEAAIGDTVCLTATEGGTERRGTIAATDEHDGHSYLRVDLDTP